MKFVMLMIPAVYRSGEPAPAFTSDPQQVEERGGVNEALGEAFNIGSPNVSANRE